MGASRAPRPPASSSPIDVAVKAHAPPADQFDLDPRGTRSMMIDGPDGAALTV
jgi:hypothetical protein